MSDVLHFEGICDVCGERISTDWETGSGAIDTGYDEKGRLYTWIRHYATAPEDANPDCAIYSSRVWQVDEDDARLEQGRSLVGHGWCPVTLRVWVRKRRFWWTAFNPDEPLAMMDTHTYFRARTRERAIEKCRRAFTPKPSKWEEVR